MKKKDEKILEGFFDAFSIPVGVFNDKNELTFSLNDFGEKLTSYYLKDAGKILNDTSGSTDPGIGFDGYGSMWIDIPLTSYKILIGPVQTGYNSDYPYEMVPEYTIEQMEGFSRLLTKSLMEKTVKVDQRYSDLTNTRVARIDSQTESEYEINGFDEIYECIRKGDIDNLEDLIHSKEMKNYLENVITDIESSKVIYIFNIAKCYHNAYDCGTPRGNLIPIVNMYLNQMRRFTNLASIRSAILRAMYDFAKAVNVYCDQSSSVYVKKVKSYISEHIYEQINIADMASSFNMSLSVLQHKFKAETGTTMTEEVTKQKIEKACFFLKYTSMSSIDIAYKLGYCSQSYFIKQFHAITGKTPTEYKSGKH